MVEQKKTKIPLAEQHRAAHAARNMAEKYLDDEIEKARAAGKEDRAKGLEVSKDGFLPAMDAMLKTFDPMVEFEDDTRRFLIGLIEKQRQKDAERAAA